MNESEQLIVTHQCGQLIAAQLYAITALTCGSLFMALFGLCATQLSPPEFRAAKMFGVLAISGAIAALCLCWAVAGFSVLLIIPMFPVIFGSMVFTAITFMKKGRI